MSITKSKLTIGTITLCLMSALTNFGQTPKQDDVRELQSNQTIEREVTGKETHRYKFDLEINEFFQVRIEQKGVDVALELLDAESKTLATMDSPNSKAGPETLTFVPSIKGSYSLEVSGFDPNAENGNYSIKRETKRLATTRDRRRIEAEGSFVKGINLRDLGGQNQAAIDNLADAYIGWQEFDDNYLMEMTLGQIIQLEKVRLNVNVDGMSGNDVANAAVQAYVDGNKLYELGTKDSLEQAIVKLEKARILFHELASSIDLAKEREAQTLNLLARVSEKLGNRRKMLNYLFLSLPLWKQTNNLQGIASALSGIGTVFYQSGDLYNSLIYSLWV